MRISDWSSDVCSSDLDECRPRGGAVEAAARLLQGPRGRAFLALHPRRQPSPERGPPGGGGVSRTRRLRHAFVKTMPPRLEEGVLYVSLRSEEHTSELQSLMRISYAVFCLKKKKTTTHNNNT